MSVSLALRPNFQHKCLIYVRYTYSELAAISVGSRCSRVLRAPETLYLYMLPKPPGSLEPRGLWSAVWNLLMMCSMTMFASNSASASPNLDLKYDFRHVSTRATSAQLIFTFILTCVKLVTSCAISTFLIM